MTRNENVLHVAKRRAGWLWALGMCVGLMTTIAVQTTLAATGSATGAHVGVINVNTASVEELQELPGIGEARARAIVERRKSGGPFSSVEQLTEIRGIGDAMLERLRPHVTLNGKSRARAK